jgi:hypothetical protein
MGNGEFVWTGFDYLGEPTPYDESWPSEVLILESMRVCLKTAFIYTEAVGIRKNQPFIFCHIGIGRS